MTIVRYWISKAAASATTAAIVLAATLSMAATASLPVQAQAYKEKVIYNFAGGVDGESPVAGVVRDSAGNFYGATNTGGANNAGTVFKLSRTGVETVLYTFTGGADGYLPYAGVILDKSGNLYGTTAFGGAFNSGTIYRVNIATDQETVLHNFIAGTSTDGSLPYAGLIEDTKGNLYGTTLEGGDISCEAGEGCGVVFKLDTMTSKETLLYTFTGSPDGDRPQASLIRDSQGNLYGTTSSGGLLNAGAVFEVNSVTHAESILYSFTGGNDGKRPLACLVRDTSGNLYGTASMGGSADSGTVFEINATGQYSTLYTFTGGTDGQYPYAGLTLDAQGNLYGTTIFGGASSDGVVFELGKTGVETVLHTFNGSNGQYPVAALLSDGKGDFYSTTELGGAHGDGVVFKLTP